MERAMPGAMVSRRRARICSISSIIEPVTSTRK